MEGAWSQFVEALSQRAKADSSALQSQVEKEDEPIEATEPESRPASPAKTPLAKKTGSKTRRLSSSSSASSEDEAASEASTDSETPAPDGEFSGLDMQALRGSAKSLTNKIHKQVREAAAAAAETRKKQRKRRRLRALAHANVHDCFPSTKSEHEASLEATALRGVIAFFANAS